MYRKGEKRLSRNSRTQGWFWGGITGLVLVSVVVVLVLVNLNKPSADERLLSVGEHKPSASVPSSSRPVSDPLVQAGAPLPALDFPIGSVEDACGFNEFPTYWVEGEGLERYYGHGIKVLESNEECRTALEAHVSAINPYLWGITDYMIRPFDFVVLEKPLTFERIFADPSGDFARVQEALSRPECLLQGDETNWELKETCHADALMNYALLNRFCFDEGVLNRDRTRFWPEDNPTPEQDRLMWKESLEDDWVRMKCETFSPELELTLEQHPVLYEFVMSLDKSDRKTKGSRELLIELAARLGDNAAGLTQETLVQYSHQYLEKGEEYGRFSWLFTGDQWWEFANKELPSADHFERVFKMLVVVGARRPDPRDEIQFDWELVAQHLCTPPYYNSKRSHEATLKFFEDVKDVLLAYREEHENPKSCREIVHEIRQQDIKFAPFRQALDKFEQVALELDVYE